MGKRSTVADDKNTNKSETIKKQRRNKAEVLNNWVHKIGLERITDENNNKLETFKKQSSLKKMYLECINVDFLTPKLGSVNKVFDPNVNCVTVPQKTTQAL